MPWRFKAFGFGLRVHSSGFGVRVCFIGFCCRGSRLGDGAYGSGFRIWGIGFRFAAEILPSIIVNFLCIYVLKFQGWARGGDMHQRILCKIGAKLGIHTTSHNHHMGRNPKP